MAQTVKRRGYVFFRESLSFKICTEIFIVEMIRNLRNALDEFK